MVCPHIKYAMAHLSRKQHISLLARPSWRRVRKTDMNVVSHPIAIPRSALRARATNRIKAMSRPKYLTKKYDLTKLPPAYQRLHPKTLTAVSSRRIVDLALPKKRLLVDRLKLFPENKGLTKNVSNLLWKVQRSRYQRYRILCNASLRRATEREYKLRAKLRRTLAKPEDWQRHTQLLAKLAVPKVVHRPEPLDRRRKWRPVNQQRLEALAQPVKRGMAEIRDPTVVSPAALTYEISNRLKEIAFRKNPPEIIPAKIPGVVSPGAIRAVASPRTIILARPTVRPAGIETDLREDAFTVSPTALKARCSRRLKLLARPKTYGRTYRK